MAIGLIGRKIGMSQIFDSQGRRVPVTVVEVGPCTVLDVRTPERDGYKALRVAFEPVSERKVTKPVAGEFKARGLVPHREIREFKTDYIDDVKAGDSLSVEIFSEGEEIKITAVSKGKGFQGGMKRHGFGGGPASHGSKFHRALGSTGMHTRPHKVGKGRKMPGHMGDEGVTIPSVKVVQVIEDKNVVLLKGTVPGGNGGIVYLEKRTDGPISKKEESAQSAPETGGEAGGES